MLQENKACQIFRKTNISYPLIGTRAWFAFCLIANDMYYIMASIKLLHEKPFLFFCFFLKKFCDTLKYFSENLYQIKNFALNFTFTVTSGMKWITTAWLFCLFSLTIILFTNRQFTKQLTSGKSYFKSSYTRNLHPDSGFNQARHYWNLIPFLTTKLNAPPKQSEHFKISSYILETFVALLKYKECLSRSVGFSVYNTKFSRSIVYIRRKHFHN